MNPLNILQKTIAFGLFSYTFVLTGDLVYKLHKKRQHRKESGGLIEKSKQVCEVHINLPKMNIFCFIPSSCLNYLF